MNQNDPEVVLKKFVRIRNKLKRSKDNKELQKQFDYYLDLCINKFRYIIATKTYKYKKFPNYQDLMQDGVVALISALRTYRPSKGNFYAWAHKYVSTKISREANKHSTIKIPMQRIKELYPVKVTNFPVIIDGSPSSSDIVECRENHLAIMDAISYLTPRQQKIITMSYGLDNIKSCAINKISKEMNISIDECERQRTEAIEKLRQHLEYNL